MNTQSIVSCQVGQYIIDQLCLDDFDSGSNPCFIANSDPYRSPVSPAMLSASQSPVAVMATPALSGPQALNTGKRAPSSGRYMCFSPSCGRSFTRVSDLNRHIATVHFTQQSRRFNCPKPDCKRKGPNAFTRRDHLLEHLRHIHRENLSKSRRGAAITTPSTPEAGTVEPKLEDSPIESKPY